MALPGTRPHRRHDYGGVAVSDLDPRTKDTLDAAVRMLSESPHAEEVVNFIYRLGVLDGQIKMSHRAEAMVRSAEADIDHAQKVWR